MLGIEAVASFVPENMIDNLEQADRFGAEREFVEKKIGVSRLPRLREDESVAYGCVEAFKTLAKTRARCTHRERRKEGTLPQHR